MNTINLNRLSGEPARELYRRVRSQYTDEIWQSLSVVEEYRLLLARYLIDRMQGEAYLMDAPDLLAELRNRGIESI